MPVHLNAGTDRINQSLACPCGWSGAWRAAGAGRGCGRSGAVQRDRGGVGGSHRSMKKYRRERDSAISRWALAVLL